MKLNSKQIGFFVSAILIAGLPPIRSASAVDQPRGTDAERANAAHWASALHGAAAPADATLSSLTSRLPTPMFSFSLGTQASSELVGKWRREVLPDGPGDQCTTRTVSYTDPATGLQVRVESVLYSDFPVVEWVVRLKNTGTADTPLLEDIRPLDVSLPASDQAIRAPIVRYSKGAMCSIDDFAPVERSMEQGASLRLHAGGGRSSSEVLPFVNADFGKEGVVLAVGWTGEWAADFTRQVDGGLHLQAGMAHTHLVLHPGEEIRTPRTMALFWQGESVRGNNLLRRFVLAHHRPMPGGKPLVLPVVVASWGSDHVTKHLETIHRVVEHDLPVELYWIDAEWYCKNKWSRNVGTWDVYKEHYPDGFRPISDLLHQSGRQFLLWFEPHRICPDTDWMKFQDRPGWLWELKDGTPEYQQHNGRWKIPHEDPRWVVNESHHSQFYDGERHWNMSNPEARRFLTDWLSDRIDAFGLDWYREDFNVAPLEYWQQADAADRQGITEIRYIEGLYAMWDELLKRHPKLAIDNCASGGRRIDLETLGRGTALCRTDWPVDAIHKQCHTWGLLSWVPLNGTGAAELKKGNEYEIRSAMAAGLPGILPPENDAKTMQETKALIEQYLSIQKFYYGDYYPLTPYSQARDVWMAYQLDLPESGEGLLVVFRRPQSPRGHERLYLKNLDGKATYRFTNVDSGQIQTFTGSQVMDEGMNVELAGTPDSALIRYERQ